MGAEGGMLSLRALNTITVTLALGLVALAGWHVQNPAHFELIQVRRRALFRRIAAAPPAPSVARAQRGQRGRGGRTRAVSCAPRFVVGARSRALAASPVLCLARDARRPRCAAPLTWSLLSFGPAVQGGGGSGAADDRAVVPPDLQ